MGPAEPPSQEPAEKVGCECKCFCNLFLCPDGWQRDGGTPSANHYLLSVSLSVCLVPHSLSIACLR